jgi:hypothetical protein
VSANEAGPLHPGTTHLVADLTEKFDAINWLVAAQGGRQRQGAAEGILWAGRNPGLAPL